LIFKKPVAETLQTARYENLSYHTNCSDYP